MTKSFIIFIFVLASLLVSCGNNKVDETKPIPSKNISAMKIQLFNNPNKLITALNENGIGDLKPWQNPQEIGWGSLTNYYQFGGQKDGVGMQNNLAYYLEGEEIFAKNILLNLNINNPAEKSDAVNRFCQIADKTFVSISQEIPNELIASIKKGKRFDNENSNMTVRFEIQKSNIETYKLLIESK